MTHDSVKNRDHLERCREILFDIISEYNITGEFIQLIRRFRDSYNEVDDDKVIERFTQLVLQPTSWVDSAGSWASTRSGHVFWSNVNAEFKKRINSDLTSKKAICKSIW